MPKTWAIPIDPQPFVTDLCWGACGHGIVGAIAVEISEGRVVMCIPCRQEKCDHVERETDFPVAEAYGELCYMRKLRRPDGI